MIYARGAVHISIQHVIIFSGAIEAWSSLMSCCSLPKPARWNASWFRNYGYGRTSFFNLFYRVAFPQETIQRPNVLRISVHIFCWVPLCDIELQVPHELTISGGLHFRYFVDMSDGGCRPFLLLLWYNIGAPNSSYRIGWSLIWRRARNFCWPTLSWYL